MVASAPFLPAAWLPGVCAFAAAVLLLALSVVLSNGVAAMMSLSHSDISSARSSGLRSDSRVLSLLGDTARLQSTLHVCTLFIDIVAVLLLENALVHFGVPDHVLRMVVAVVAVFVLLLLLGVLMRRVSRDGSALSRSRRAAPFVSLLSRLFFPLARAYSSAFASICAFPLAGRHVPAGSLPFAPGLVVGDDASQEGNMLKSIVRFGDETVSGVMTSRLDMVDIDISASFGEICECVEASAFSRIPVYEETRDNIVGILYIKDLLPHIAKGEAFEWQSLMRKPFFVPETKKIGDLLKEFQKNKVHIAIVVDEFGGTSGLITMEDIIEEIVGDIQDEYDDDEQLYSKLDDSTYLFEGKILLSDFYRVIGGEPPEIESLAVDSETLAGLLLEIKGEFPALHEHVRVGNYDFEVMNVDKRRILKVKLTIDESNK